MGPDRVMFLTLVFYRSCSRPPFFVGLSNFRGPVFNFSSSLSLRLSLRSRRRHRRGRHPERGNEGRQGVGKAGWGKHQPQPARFFGVPSAIFCG